MYTLARVYYKVYRFVSRNCPYGGEIKIKIKSLKFMSRVIKERRAPKKKMFFKIIGNIFFFSFKIKRKNGQSSGLGSDITRYRNTYLISARLLGCLRMSPLHDVALDDVERSWRREKWSYAWTESDSYTIKYNFWWSQTTANGTKYL